jgi:hypothetical protein
MAPYSDSRSPLAVKAAMGDGLLPGRQGTHVRTGLRLRFLGGVVLSVGDFLLPDHVLDVPAAGDHQVRHRRVRRRSVPVFDVGRTTDGLALPERDHFAVTGAGKGDARGDDHVLPCRVKVPGGAGTGLEGDVRAGVMGGVVAGEQHVDAHVAGEIVLRALERLLGAGRVEGLPGGRRLRPGGRVAEPTGQGEQHGP